MECLPCIAAIQDKLKLAIQAKGIKIGSLKYLDERLIIPEISNQDADDEINWKIKTIKVNQDFF